jgi:ppGpp synthetase/RelA/SpoT-type nucleotidyltranferase
VLRLTSDERERIREVERRLHDPGFRARLQRVQDIVQKELEKYRDQCERLTVRAVVGRTQIKGVARALSKLQERRQDLDSQFWVTDLDDLVGVKVVCPYPSDAGAVIDWMRSQNGFKVSPDSNQAARRERENGYRGFHFVVRLGNQLVPGNEDLMGIKCEVQVKTMLEEAWDAKTHDVSYRREKQIAPLLIREMKKVSSELAALDQRTEELKRLILEREDEERKRKDAVVAVLVQQSVTNEEVREAIARVEGGSAILLGRFTPENATSLVPLIQECRESGSLTMAWCRVAALVGVYGRGTHLDTWAIEVCEDLIRQKPDDPKIYLATGFVCWALDRLDDALETTEAGIDRAKGKGGEVTASLKGNFAYYTAEKAWGGIEVEASVIERAREYIDDAIRAIPNDAAYLDTKGFFLITTGSTTSEIEQGVDLVNQARQMVDELGENVAQAFYARHLRVAKTKLEA